MASHNLYEASKTFISLGSAADALLFLWLFCVYLIRKHVIRQSSYFIYIFLVVNLIFPLVAFALLLTHILFWAKDVNAKFECENKFDQIVHLHGLGISDANLEVNDFE